MEEYERLSACKAELEQKNTKYAAAMQTMNAKGQDFDAKRKEIEEKIQARSTSIADEVSLSASNRARSSRRCSSGTSPVMRPTLSPSAVSFW